MGRQGMKWGERVRFLKNVGFSARSLVFGLKSTLFYRDSLTTPNQNVPFATVLHNVQWKERSGSFLGLCDTDQTLPLAELASETKSQSFSSCYKCFQPALFSTGVKEAAFKPVKDPLPPCLLQGCFVSYWSPWLCFSGTVTQQALLYSGYFTLLRVHLLWITGLSCPLRSHRNWALSLQTEFRNIKIRPFHLWYKNSIFPVLGPVWLCDCVRKVTRRTQVRIHVCISRSFVQKHPALNISSSTWLPLCQVAWTDVPHKEIRANPRSILKYSDLATMFGQIFLSRAQYS